jgi:hypothetical protein
MLYGVCPLQSMVSELSIVCSTVCSLPYPFPAHYCHPQLLADPNLITTPYNKNICSHNDDHDNGSPVL